MTRTPAPAAAPGAGGTPEELTWVADHLATSAPATDQLLSVLHAIQRQFGHVSGQSMRLVAEALNLTRAEVYGVVSFYEDFREAPAGRHHVQICMAEACQAVGCRALAAHAERHLGVSLGETTPGGAVHLEAAYCFGNCAAGPTLRIGDRIHGRVTNARFEQLLAPLLSRGAAS